MPWFLCLYIYLYICNSRQTYFPQSSVHLSPLGYMHAHLQNCAAVFRHAAAQATKTLNCPYFIDSLPGLMLILSGGNHMPNEVKAFAGL